MKQAKHVYFDFDDGRQPPVAIRAYDDHRQLARFADHHEAFAYAKKHNYIVHARQMEMMLNRAFNKKR